MLNCMSLERCFNLLNQCIGHGGQPLVLHLSWMPSDASVYRYLACCYIYLVCVYRYLAYVVIDVVFVINISYVCYIYLMFIVVIEILRVLLQISCVCLLFIQYIQVYCFVARVYRYLIDIEDDSIFPVSVLVTMGGSATGLTFELDAK